MSQYGFRLNNVVSDLSMSLQPYCIPSSVVGAVWGGEGPTAVQIPEAFREEME